MREPQVIYENSQVLIVDKPPGLVVNRAESVRVSTLQDWIEQNYKFQTSKDKDLRSGIVHRLDKDTSGVMAVAKTKEAFQDLQRQFREREVEKTYVALTHGRLEPRRGVMSLPLARKEKERKQFAVRVAGKQAETRWKVREYLKRGEEVFSLVELYPKTGRTHQLRVHLKHLRHPIVGDRQYLSKKRAKADGQWCPRQFLHASKLCVDLGRKRKCFEAELAGDLREVLAALES